MIDLYYEFPDFDTYIREGSIVARNLRAWCKENCTQYFIIDVLGHNLRFSFCNEEDAVGFKLRWL